MPKIWDQLIKQAASEGTVIKIEIEGHSRAFGQCAFSVPGLKEWAANNEMPNQRPEPWGKIKDVIYFTFKDEWENINASEASIGLHMNVYSNDEAFRKHCYSIAKLHLDRKLKVDSMPEKERPSILTWKQIPDQTFVKRVLKFVPRFVSNVLLKTKIDRQ